MKGSIMKIRVLTKVFTISLLTFLLFNSSVKAQLTGGNTYPINGVQNPPTSFSTVGRAFTYLNANGTNGTGTITLEITSGYLGDSGTIAALTAYPGMNASRPIVLKPGSGQNPAISTSPAANSAVIRFNGARYFTIDGSNNGTSSRNLTITTTSTTATVRLVDLVPTASSSCKFITVKNVKLLGYSTASDINTLYGIYLGSGTGTGAAATSGNDSNLFQNNLIEAVRNGIYLRGTNSAGQYDSYNRVLDNTIGGTVAPGGSQNTTFFGGADDVSGIFMNSQQDGVIQNNTIRNSRPANRYVRGIHLASLAQPGAANKNITINANWIMNLAYSGSGAWANHGIRVQTNNNTANNIRITNNFISNIAADGDNLANSFEYAIAGIQLPSNASAANSDVGIHIYNNTINLYDNGTQKLGTGAGRVAACIIMQTNVAGGIRILNNNLYNSYPGGSTANSRVVAIYSQNTTINPFLPANNGRSNNNNLYVNGNNATNHIGFLLNSNQTTLGNWKSNAVDSASVNVNPNFLSSSAPYTYENSLNNAGAPTGVTQDIDFKTRSNTTPDIGATEFTPPAFNIELDNILNVSSGCNLTQLNIEAQIKNLVNAIPSGDTIVFWYRVNTGSKVWDTAFLSSSIGSSNTFQFSFNQPYNISSAGQYAIWVGFNYGKDTITADDSLQLNIISAACLTGGTTYNINGTQNPPTSFATVADAFTHLNNNGTTGTGTITFSIASGYTGETGVIPPLTAYLGMDASRPIVLKPASGQTPTISTTTAANSGVIRLNGVKYFTIDGSNSGTSTRDLTITTSSTTATARLVDLIPTATSSCEFITVKNVNLRGNSSTTAVNTLYGIYLGSGTGTGAALTSGNDSNLIENNLIEAVRNGIYLRGTNSAYDEYNRVVNNTIGGTIGTGGSQNTTYFGGANTISGIYMNSQQNSLIEGNLVRNSVQANYYARGIHLEAISATGAANKNVTINANRIHSLVYAGVGEWANHGMRIETNDNTGANILVTNNAIANIAADGFTYTTTPNFLIAGIQLASASSSDNTNVGIKLYHNSINLYDNGTQELTDGATNSGAACIVLEEEVAGGVQIVNNILQNTYPAVSSAVSKTYGIYVKNGTNNPFLPGSNGRSNHNDIYSGSSSATNVTGYILGADEVSLTDWQGNNVDSNSLSVNAQYTDDITLHTLSADLNNQGTPVGVTKDINNNNRTSTAPDLGIGEYNPPTYNIGFVEVDGLASGCNLGTKTVKVRYRNAGILSIPAGDTIVFWYKVDTATAVVDTLFMPTAVAPGDSFDFSFAQSFVFSQYKKHSIQVYANYNKDLFPENDSVVIEVENMNCITSPSTVADFESSDEGYTHNGGWVRGTPAKATINTAGSGSKAWVVEGLTGEYSDNMRSYFYSPLFDFSTACEPKVSWLMRFILELNWDAVILEGTTDNVNWVKINSITPGYNNTSGNGPMAPNKFSGDNGAWTKYTADLSAFANAPMFRFRFYFATDGSNTIGTHEGIAVDSIAVQFYPTLDNLNLTSNLQDDTAFIQAPYTFTSGVGAGNVKHYWYVDGVLKDSVNSSYTTSWATTGTHVIKYVARNCAMADSVTDTVTVVTPVGLPTIDFLASRYSLNAGETVNLSSVTGNGVINWQWIITPDMNYDYLSQNVVPTYSFSGNLTSPNANLMFLLGGKYDVCLVAENVNGIDTLCKTQYIEVFDVASVCAFPSVPYPAAKIFDSGMGTGNYANNENCTAVIELECADTIYLKLNSLQTELNTDYLRIYDGDEDPANAMWDISQYPNGLSGSLAGINNLPAVMKSSNGYATIRFTSNGSVPSQGFEIEYTSSAVTVKPNASFDLPDTSCPATPLQPVNTGTTNGATNYQWDIDGDNSNDYSGANPTFQYASAGTYTVRLIVSNCIGPDTFYKTIVIAAPATKPSTTFSADILNPIVGDEVRLTDLTAGCVQGVAWSISPNSFSYVQGTSASSKNPIVVFNATGCYDVTLVTWNGIGYDTLKQTCYINVMNTCTPQAQLNSDIGISRVALNTIDNQTAAGTQAYSNYTNTISTVVVKGERYELTIERPTNLNNMSRRAWIDFDQDGTFSASEVVALENNAQTLQFKANIRIPRNALSGYTRLRVAAAFTSGSPSPCGGFIGEFEDYRIIIIGDTVKPVITLTGS
ncbi:MAG TPA: GEVED domain-containing protein, partial [Bacteroidia bacterium]|nr:GEVED domain-containing protein [Bacteroidia bacterium]